MKRGDLVYERYGDRYGVILFVDDENPDCFGIMFVGANDWCFGYSEDLEAVCKQVIWFMCLILVIMQ